LISFSIARAIVRSLSVLVEKSSAIGQGYFNEPVVLNTGDEVEEVAHSLDSARLNLKHKVEELQKSRMELEMRVEERTGELSNIVSRMQSLLESTDEGIYGTDKDGVCIVFNKSASIMTGFELEDVIGKTIHGLIHCKHEDGSPYLFEDCLIEQVVNTGKKIRVSTEIFWRKNGTSFPVEYSACPILEGGLAKGVVIAFTDITERKRAEELSHALVEINADISSTLEIDQIMQKVVCEATKAIGAESGVILTRANDTWIVSHSFGRLEEMMGKQFDSVEIKRAVECARNGKAFVFNEINYKRDEPGRIANRYNIKSCICVPLSTKDNLIGILAVVYHSAPTLFAKNQIDFVDKLAFSISLALENARLYQEESNIADTLQEALLVLPEKIEGISFGHLYRSATVAARVGGDFYDLFELEHKKVGIVVGDVSGKGIEASTLTSIIKNTLKAYSYEGDSPAMVLYKTNNIIAKTSPSGLFVTLFLGILDISTRSLIYCNAGHPAPIIKSERSQVVLLDANSPIVGAFSDLQFLEETAILAENDMLILYTDGVIEARCDGVFLGEEQLIEIIEQIEPATPKDLPELIFNKIIEYTRNNLSDDVAMLTISIAGKTN
jgi:PAS domain S-box-containing protein